MNTLKLSTDNFLIKSNQHSYGKRIIFSVDDSLQFWFVPTTRVDFCSDVFVQLFNFNFRNIPWNGESECYRIARTMQIKTCI